MTHIRYILHPFIATTAVATFFHNLWTISFVFGGKQPVITDWSTLLQFIGWVLPGVLVSFSLDVGLLATAVQLSQKRTVRKAVTFAVLAMYMFVGQEYYLVTHTEQIAIGSGVSPSLMAWAIFIRDVIVILLPLMLPLSTILYVLSYDAPETSQKVTERANQQSRRQSLTEGMESPPVAEIVSPNGAEGKARKLPFGRGKTAAQK